MKMALPWNPEGHKGGFSMVRNETLLSAVAFKDGDEDKLVNNFEENFFYYCLKMIVDAFADFTADRYIKALVFIADDLEQSPADLESSVANTVHEALQCTRAVIHAATPTDQDFKAEFATALQGTLKRGEGAERKDAKYRESRRTFGGLYDEAWQLLKKTECFKLVVNEAVHLGEEHYTAVQDMLDRKDKIEECDSLIGRHAYR